MRHLFRKFVKRVKPVMLLLTKSGRRHRLVGPPDLWKMKRDFQIKFLKDHGLKPEHYLKDIGCGTLRGGIPLIDYLKEGHYFGIETRKEVLDEGRMELKEAGLNWKSPTLLTTEQFTKGGLLQKFDFIWAFSVLIHMTDEILNDTLDIVKNHLYDSGFFYANVQIGDRDEGTGWQGFPGVWRSLDFYREACYRHRLVVSDMGQLKDLGHISGVEDQDAMRVLKIEIKEEIMTGRDLTCPQ